MKIRITFCALLWSVAMQMGCMTLDDGGATVLGPKTYTYSQGDLISDEAVGLDQAWRATLAAMNELRYSVTEQGKDNLQARVHAESPGDVKVQVQLFAVKETETRVTIRVGSFGDEVMSKRILDHVKAHFAAATLQ